MCLTKDIEDWIFSSKEIYKHLKHVNELKDDSIELPKFLSAARICFDLIKPTSNEDIKKVINFLRQKLRLGHLARLPLNHWKYCLYGLEWLGWRHLQFLKHCFRNSTNMHYCHRE